MMKSELRRLAEFIYNLTWEQLPDKVQEAVSYRVLDLVSVSIGAAEDPLVKNVSEFYKNYVGEGKCHVWGWKETFPMETAAMLNAMLAHTLELDDVHPASKTHGSASLIPAAWAVAEKLGASGKEFLTAVVCGYETVSRIGKAMGVSEHRNRGWHATATCGVFGCAAACAKLLNLNVEQIISSLGMAGTQSCGVWAFLGDGSNCKILHTGRAAVNGIESAFLARQGMTGPEHILDALDGGLLYAMSNGGDIQQISADLGSVYEILNMDMKPYPCCRSAHCAIDCALEIRDRMIENQNNDEELEKIFIKTYLVGYKQCAVSDGCCNPRNILDAKFSMPYAVAAALLFGKVTMEEFTNEKLADPELRKMIEKIHVSSDEYFTSQYPKHWGCEMEVILKNGTVYRALVNDPSGSIHRPLTRQQVIDKAAEFIKVCFLGKEQTVIEDLLNISEMKALPHWK